MVLTLLFRGYRFHPSGADSARAEHCFNGGLTYLVNHDMQLDVRGGEGLNDEADDYFFGSEITIRCR